MSRRAYRGTPLVVACRSADDRLNDLERELSHSRRQLPERKRRYDRRQWQIYAGFALILVLIVLMIIFHVKFPKEETNIFWRAVSGMQSWIGNPLRRFRFG
jgi:hypothetical protein